MNESLDRRPRRDADDDVFFERTKKIRALDRFVAARVVVVVVCRDARGRGTRARYRRHARVVVGRSWVGLLGILRREV